MNQEDLNAPLLQDTGANDSAMLREKFQRMAAEIAVVDDHVAANPEQFEADVAEVAALKAALIAGKVDGNVYEGACACLIGTIANARHCEYESLIDVNPELRPNPNRPAERWFLAILPGMRISHPIVSVTLAWIDEWTAARTS